MNEPELDCVKGDQQQDEQHEGKASEQAVHAGSIPEAELGYLERQQPVFDCVGRNQQQAVQSVGVEEIQQQSIGVTKLGRLAEVSEQEAQQQGAVVVVSMAFSAAGCMGLQQPELGSVRQDQQHRQIEKVFEQEKLKDNDPEQEERRPENKQGARPPPSQLEMTRFMMEQQAQ